MSRPERNCERLGARMPEGNWTQPTATEGAQASPRSPYEIVACAAWQAILAGVHAHGDAAPTVKELAAEHSVSIGTSRSQVSSPNTTRWRTDLRLSGLILARSRWSRWGPETVAEPGPVESR
jgi:hypothetical protein